MPMASVDALVVFKAIAGRPRDIDDASRCFAEPDSAIEDEDREPALAAG